MLWLINEKSRSWFSCSFFVQPSRQPARTIVRRDSAAGLPGLLLQPNNCSGAGAAQSDPGGSRASSSEQLFTQEAAQARTAPIRGSAAWFLLLSEQLYDETQVEGPDPAPIRGEGPA